MSLHDCDEKQHRLLRVSSSTIVQLPPPKCRKYLFHVALTRRSKVRFAPTSFYACGKKDAIRPLPCSSFPTATRCAGLAVGGPPCGRHFSRLRNIDFNRPFHVGASFVSLAPTYFISQSALTPLLLASSRNRCAGLRLGIAATGRPFLFPNFWSRIPARTSPARHYALPPAGRTGYNPHVTIFYKE